jgi:rRNA-processing protein FCF1
MVSVVVDTSIIKGAGWKKAPLLSLFALAKDGSIDLYIPETAYHEVRTQWREKYDASLRELNHALRSMQKADLLPASEKTVLEALDVEIKKATNSEDLSLTTFDNLFKEHNVTVRPCTPDQMARAWAAYFKGEPPFGSVKDREDLPDAHIFETIKDLASEKPSLFILCADGRLSKACATLPDVAVVGKIDDFLNDPIVKTAERETKLTKHWDSVKASLTAEIDEEIIHFLHANAGDLLTGALVRDHGIPSDNNDAHVTMYGNIENISITDKDEFAKGYMSCVVSFTSECLLDFYVSKWDAYDVPDWVSVSGGDPEEDHYFEAEGEKEIAGSIELTLKINLREDYNDDEDIFEEIQISGKPDLHLA